MINRNNIEIVKFMIPAVIDCCRDDGNNLLAGSNYFLNARTSDNKKIGTVKPSVFSINEIEKLLTKLNIFISLNDVISGAFINSEILKIRGIDEKQFILNVLKLALKNPKLTIETDSIIRSDEYLLKYSERLTLEDIQMFWKTMLDYEILYLIHGIKDLGFGEWNNFGIGIYNKLATTDNKSPIFNEVNKILTYILFPHDLIYPNTIKDESKFRINFANDILEIKYIDLDSTRFDSLKQLLDYLYKTYLYKILPKFSYEKNWVLEHDGCFIRKDFNNKALSLIDLGIEDGTELNLFKLIKL
jgi:hypothetical protein